LSSQLLSRDQQALVITILRGLHEDIRWRTIKGFLNTLPHAKTAIGDALRILAAMPSVEDVKENGVIGPIYMLEGPERAIGVGNKVLDEVEGEGE